MNGGSEDVAVDFDELDKAVVAIMENVRKVSRQDISNFGEKPNT